MPRLRIQLSHSFREAVSPRHQADLVRQQIQLPDVNRVGEEDRANPAAQKLFRQAFQFAARIVQQLSRAAFLGRKQHAAGVHRDDQRRPCRQRDAQLMLGGGQAFHQARVVALV
jgi:hypothetical protein